MLLHHKVAAVALSAATVLAGAACTRTSGPDAGRVITAIGAENEYANVIGQIGGKYVQVTAIESNPNTDPHSFEASPSVAQAVSSAQLVVQNGVGYDTYMNRIEAAAPSSSRTVIDVQSLLRLPDTTPNPHLWYQPGTMPAVARTLAGDLAKLQPAHAAYFQANLHAFDRSLQPWYQALARFKAAYPGTPVAVTEPVGDYLLQAAGARIVTPFRLQADIMNGVDPAPQDISLESGLLSGHKVKVILYNQQVTDSLTQSFLSQAHRYGIPVVGVYETMPAWACTRPCRHRVMTISRGCSPRSTPCSRRCPPRSQRRNCDDDGIRRRGPRGRWRQRAAFRPRGAA